MKYLEQIKKYWDSRSEGYSLQIEQEREEKKDDFYRAYFQSLPSGSSVLDIGCGPGFFSLLLANWNESNFGGLLGRYASKGERAYSSKQFCRS
jgi:2-polyprenyl-3-methyl-5-hydroxy-6-metoxy-1,4-benzoquinol methylase